MPSSENLPPVSGSVNEALVRLYRMPYGSGRCSNSLEHMLTFRRPNKNCPTQPSLCWIACDMCLLHIFYPCDAIMAVPSRMEDFRTVGASLTTRCLSGSACTTTLGLKYWSGLSAFSIVRTSRDCNTVVHKGISYVPFLTNCSISASLASANRGCLCCVPRPLRKEMMLPVPTVYLSRFRLTRNIRMRWILHLDGRRLGQVDFHIVIEPVLARKLYRLARVATIEARSWKMCFFRVHQCDRGGIKRNNSIPYVHECSRSVVTALHRIWAFIMLCFYLPHSNVGAKLLHWQRKCTRTVLQRGSYTSLRSECFRVLPGGSHCFESLLLYGCHSIFSEQWKSRNGAKKEQTRSEAVFSNCWGNRIDCNWQSRPLSVSAKSTLSLLYPLVRKHDKGHIWLLWIIVSSSRSIINDWKALIRGFIYRIEPYIALLPSTRYSADNRMVPFTDWQRDMGLHRGVFCGYAELRTSILEEVSCKSSYLVVGYDFWVFFEYCYPEFDNEVPRVFRCMIRPPFSRRVPRASINYM